MRSVAVRPAAEPRIIRSVGDLSVITSDDGPRRPRAGASLPSVILADILAATTTAVVAIIASPTVTLSHRIVGSATVVGAWLAMSAALGVVRVARLGALEEARRAFGAALVGSLVALVVFGGDRSSMFAVAILGSFSAFVTRGTRRIVFTRRASTGVVRDRVIVIGTSEAAGDLAHEMMDHDRSYQPLGFVVVDGPPVSPNGLGLLGPMSNLVDIVREHAVDRIVVPHGEISQESAAHLLDVARRAGVEVVVSTQLPSMRSSGLVMEPLGKHMAVSVRPASLSRAQAFAKRALDLILGSAFIVLLSPVMVACALAVRMTSRGPVLFRQERVTKGGAVFEMLKFRTMVVGAEDQLDTEERAKPFFKRNDDHRVTKVGRGLRRFSLDELPQLFNVLAGTMTLVGPRPLPVAQVRANADLLAPRHEVPAGVTGWWQVNGRNDRDLAESVSLDMYYIRNWSVLLDLYILARTVRAVVDRRAR